jgi:hypothetical protein
MSGEVGGAGALFGFLAEEDEACVRSFRSATATGAAPPSAPPPSLLSPPQVLSPFGPLGPSLDF